MPIKEVARKLLPPIVVDLLRRFKPRFPAMGAARPEWEYVPQGWSRKDETNGWNVASVVAINDGKWEEFRRLLAGTGPLGVAHEAAAPSNGDFSAHNTVVSFAYALTLASRGKDRMTMLDWGGGIGHYKLIAEAVLPNVEIEYCCKDLPLLCKRGRELLPDATFFDDEVSALQRTYDFVLVSSALQYSRDWKGTLTKLALIAGSHLFVTRTPFVSNVPSFVVVQRPYKYGYATEYLGWFINRNELLEAAKAGGLELVREVLINEQHFVPGVPEQCRYGGFLFRKNHP